MLFTSISFQHLEQQFFRQGTNRSRTLFGGSAGVRRARLNGSLPEHTKLKEVRVTAFMGTNGSLENSQSDIIQIASCAGNAFHCTFCGGFPPKWAHVALHVALRSVFRSTSLRLSTVQSFNPKTASNCRVHDT